jgi:hypothetical protein
MVASFMGLGTENDQKIFERRSFTISELSCEFPQISLTLLCDIITVRLSNDRKFCERWVPKMLTGAHKMQKMASGLTFLQRYHKDGDEFLSHIIRITDDETRGSLVNIETKKQSKQWMHTYSPNNATKFKQMLPACQKVYSNSFWIRKRVRIVEFMQQGTTITSKVYCEVLKNRRVIQNKTRGMLTTGVVVLHENTRPLIASSTRALLKHLIWELFDHSHYSLISLRATSSVYLPEGRWDESASTIMRS